MKLITFEKDHTTSIGILTRNGVIDIRRAWPAGPENMLEILALGPPCLEKLAAIAQNTDPNLPLDSLRLLAPIPRPGKLLALAGNYAEHIKEAGHEKGFELGLSEAPRNTTTPRPFIMPSTAVLAPDSEIPWPLYSEQIDYELELAVVIGRECKAIPASDAPAHIAGYTIANDISARTVTFKNGRKPRPWDEFYDWLNGKWSDGFCPLGPAIVTADEIPDPQNLDMRLTVNSETRQNARTAQMIYPVADLVSFISHLMTLEPGDVICTGTPSGVGVATGNFLKPGDRIEAHIQHLGTLTSTIGPKPDSLYTPLKT